MYLLQVKEKNNQLFINDQYLSLIIKVKELKNKITKKTAENYQRLARSDIVETEASEKLIVLVKNEGDPSHYMYYTHLDETSQIIPGHGSRIRMIKELKLRYKNVTAEIIIVYLNLC